jgi:hypothetical protein
MTQRTPEATSVESSDIRRILECSETIDLIPPYKCLPPPDRQWLGEKIKRISKLFSAERIIQEGLRGEVERLRNEIREHQPDIQFSMSHKCDSPITFFEDDGTERKLVYEHGDKSVGIGEGYVPTDNKWGNLQSLLALKDKALSFSEEALGRVQQYIEQARKDKVSAVKFVVNGDTVELVESALTQIQKLREGNGA